MRTGNDKDEDQKFKSQRERDPILDSTPNVTPQMMATMNDEVIQQEPQQQASMSDIVQDQLELNLTQSNSSDRQNALPKHLLDTKKLE